MSRLWKMLNVKFSGRRGCDKDELVGFERLKVDDNHPHGRGSLDRALFSV